MLIVYLLARYEVLCLDTILHKITYIFENRYGASAFILF